MVTVPRTPINWIKGKEDAQMLRIVKRTVCYRCYRCWDGEWEIGKNRIKG